MRLLPRPRKSLRGYLDQYASEHTKLGTKITHCIGIPLIVASFPTVFVNPPLAGGMLGTGWALQLVGHAVFEKQKPSFFADPFYLLVGPIWVAIEVGQLTGLVPRPLFKDKAPAVARAQNGTSRRGASAQPSA
jgi:uncharacterized membrane protein YGL010W